MVSAVVPSKEDYTIVVIFTNNGVVQGQVSDLGILRCSLRFVPMHYHRVHSC